MYLLGQRNLRTVKSLRKILTARKTTKRKFVNILLAKNSNASEVRIAHFCTQMFAKTINLRDRMAAKLKTARNCIPIFAKIQ